MSKTAILYRMVTDEHICPYGLRSKDLLEREGFSVEDHHLTSREEIIDQSILSNALWLFFSAYS